MTTRNSQFRATIPAWISAMFRVAAIVNALIALPSVLAPARAAKALGMSPPSPRFPTRAWSGMALMTGLMYREIALDPEGNRHLIRCGWISKLVSATAVTIGYRSGEASRSSLILITLVDWALIPPFIYAAKTLAETANDRAVAEAVDDGRGVALADL